MNYCYVFMTQLRCQVLCKWIFVWIVFHEQEHWIGDQNIKSKYRRLFLCCSYGLLSEAQRLSQNFCLNVKKIYRKIWPQKITEWAIHEHVYKFIYFELFVGMSNLEYWIEMHSTVLQLIAFTFTFTFKQCDFWLWLKTMNDMKLF